MEEEENSCHPFKSPFLFSGRRTFWEKKRNGGAEKMSVGRTRLREGGWVEKKKNLFFFFTPGSRSPEGGGQIFHNKKLKLKGGAQGFLYFFAQSADRTKIFFFK